MLFTIYATLHHNPNDAVFIDLYNLHNMDVKIAFCDVSQKKVPDYTRASLTSICELTFSLTF